ncbi:MAG TPA: SRPBCC family protein [Candidatus Saccharimonas sp.]|nr:SRPBCC family protein [Candidatus Saccharimonas sp.]
MINARPARVWASLTEPALVKQIMYGAEVVSDWKVGSPLLYRGTWEGKPFEDKGTILKIEPNKLLKATYFSEFSGLEDKPENYNVVTYELAEAGGGTKLTVTQENCPSQESADHSTKNWERVLETTKELLEKSA